MSSQKMTELSIKNTELIKSNIQKDGLVYSLIKGVSMRPMLKQGRDIVVIEAVSLDDIKINDCLLYKRENYDFLPLHRVLKIKGETLIIRGDNTYKLEYVPKDYVVGRLKAFYRKGKYYDCEKSLKYKIYVFYNRATYLPRCFWKRGLRPRLSKIYHLVFKRK
ncbi:MAG: hypothetical protein IJP34_02255 [Clostridia bacterium]|nr:hypothetical protein [Clostridia bacterium]